MNLKWQDERNKVFLNLIKNELFIYFNVHIECNNATELFKSDEKLVRNAKSKKNMFGRIEN